MRSRRGGERGENQMGCLIGLVFFLAVVTVVPQVGRTTADPFAWLAAEVEVPGPKSALQLRVTAYDGAIGSRRERVGENIARGNSQPERVDRITRRDLLH